MIFHALTAILVLLKILGVISISWWLALAPSLVLSGVLVLILVLSIIALAFAKS